MSRGREIVEEYKKVMRLHFDSPSLVEVSGDWYFIQHPESPPWVMDLKEPIHEGGLNKEGLEARGYTVTPVMVHKVIAIR